jgi:hypothetical protein
LPIPRSPLVTKDRREIHQGPAIRVSRSVFIVFGLGGFGITHRYPSMNQNSTSKKTQPPTLGSPPFLAPDVEMTRFSSKSEKDRFDLAAPSSPSP